MNHEHRRFQAEGIEDISNKAIANLGKEMVIQIQEAFRTSSG